MPSRRAVVLRANLPHFTLGRSTTYPGTPCRRRRTTLRCHTRCSAHRASSRSWMSRRSSTCSTTTLARTSSMSLDPLYHLISVVTESVCCPAGTLLRKSSNASRGGSTSSTSPGSSGTPSRRRSRRSTSRACTSTSTGRARGVSGRRATSASSTATSLKTRILATAAVAPQRHSRGNNIRRLFLLPWSAGNALRSKSHCSHM